jgi:LemA protein
MFWLIIGLALFSVFCMVWIYNRLVRRQTLVKEAWSGIQVQLKRRYELVPNLVNIVKGYRSHEKEVLNQVTEARAASMAVQDVKAKGAAEDHLARSLKNLFAVAEAYPDLKANQNFLELQKELSDIEEQLQMSRRYYNATVRDYNIAVHTFPGNLISPLFGFSDADFFAGVEAEAQPPAVGF